jgi:hypothetical protein
MPAVELRPNMKNLLGFSAVCKGAISLPFQFMHVNSTVDPAGARQKHRYMQAVLRIRIFASRIPGQKDSRIRIRIKDFKYLTQKVVFKLSET